MYCPNCGKENNDSAKFCKHCGEQITPHEELRKSTTDGSSKIAFIWGYRFQEAPGYGITDIQSAIEQKSDYQLIEHDLIKKNIFVYEKGSGKGVGIIVVAKRKGEMFIVGNEKGLVSARSRYSNKKFKKLHKEKIQHDEMDKSLAYVIVKYSIPQGREKDAVSGVNGWLALFVLGIFLTAIINIVTSFTELSGWGLIDIALGGYGLFVGYLLLSTKPKAVKHTKIFLVTTALLGLALLIFLASVSDGSDEINEAMTNAGRTIFYGVIWFWYFSVSRRVKATYIS